MTLTSQQTFEVELTASDPFGMSGSTMVTITVTDFNEEADAGSGSSRVTTGTGGT